MPRCKREQTTTKPSWRSQPTFEFAWRPSCQTEHGDAFLNESQKFLVEDTDPLVAVLDQWMSTVRKAQAETKYCLGCGRTCGRELGLAAEPDEYIRKLCVTRAWAAELQYWLQLGEDDRVQVVVNKTFHEYDPKRCAQNVKDSSAALLREFCGRSFFERGHLDYAQRYLRAALRHCSTERVSPCTQLLVLVDLLLGENDEVIQEF
ncbi:hypothetical protein AAVH_20849 [Aphelenchoides avenae]|nr:hypothetical protein AAVH_20849 [Aphelenchus avenae]